MKQRKLAVVAFLLIAVFTIGIGYAALTDLLTITGNSIVTAAGAEVGFDEKIYFTSATVTQGSSTGSYVDSARIDQDNPDSASFSVNSLNSSDDVVIITYVVTNNSDHNATITVSEYKAGSSTNPNPSLDNDDFNITYTIANGGAVAAKGGTVEVVVTIRLADGVTPPTTGSLSGLYDLELTATTAD